MDVCLSWNAVWHAAGDVISHGCSHHGDMESQQRVWQWDPANGVNEGNPWCFLLGESAEIQVIPTLKQPSEAKKTIGSGLNPQSFLPPVRHALQNAIAELPPWHDTAAFVVDR